MNFSRTWCPLSVCLIFLWSTIAAAFDLGAVGLKRGDLNSPSATSEYIYRIDSEQPLIPVYLLGAVAKPGLYHIPRNMDIVGLLTLAGGTTENAELDHIVVKGEATGERRQLNFDLDQAVHNSSPVKLALVSNDLVYVTPSKPSQYTALAIVGLIAGVATIVISGILIKQNVH